MLDPASAPLNPVVRLVALAAPQPPVCRNASKRAQREFVQWLSHHRRGQHPRALSKLRSLINARQQGYAGTVASYGPGTPAALVVPDSHGDAYSLPVDTIGFAVELLLSPVSQQNQAAGGEGSRWFGVDTLQDPMDATALASVIWETRPQLIIEIGTECGGSAIFMAQLLRSLRLPQRPKLITYDVVAEQGRPCAASVRARGLESTLWRELKEEGILEPRVANVTSTEELQRIARAVREAERVLVIDDGDHFATPLILHFELLWRFVTPGSYYLVQDTRLDRTCAAQAQLTQRLNQPWNLWKYCQDIIGAEGGPARAVRYLECESAAFARHFAVDRSKEKWIFTQHPGGWLRRLHKPRPRS